MRAAIYDKHCNEGIGFTEDHPSPKPGSNDILIKVHAAGFNPVDFKMPDVPILGYLKKGKPVCHDFAGTVLAIGDRCQNLGYNVGDRVYGTTKSGVCCEQIAVHPCYVAKMPDIMSFEEAAALPLAVVTTYQALVLGGVKPGSRVMVIGASGGTGTLGVQMAKAMGASHVTAVTSEGNADFVRGLGADEVIDYRKHGEDIMAGVKNAAAASESEPNEVDPDTDMRYDMVYDTVTSLDPVDTNYTVQTDKLLRPGAGGRYVAINGTVWDWTTTLIGASFGRRRMLIYDDAKTSEVLPVISKWVEEGKLRVIIDAQVPFTANGVQDAFRRLKSRRAKGKVVCKII